MIVLIWNVDVRTRGVDFNTRSGGWTRAWDDVAIGSGFAAFDSFPVAPYLVTNGFSRKGQTAFDEFKETFRRLEGAHQTRLSRPWEGFAAPELFPRRPRVAQRFDDWGRAYLLGWGFRVVGSVAPGLLFWLGPALAILVLFWVIAEALGSGLPLFGLVTAVLVSVSSFCVDVLMLGYSATGFYLISILVCLAFGIGALGRPPTLSGWMARSLLAGILFGLAVIARSVSWTVLPALLIIATLGALRIEAARWQRLAVASGTLICLIGPALVLRAHLADSAHRASDRFGGEVPPASHDVWITYWQGLGDFDRTHGHAFLDEAGLATLREHGGRERVSERSEAIMSRLVIESIRSEPSWFARILFQRAIFTLSFRKLWPSAAAGSPGFYPSTTPNEGVTDSYWEMTDQADTFRLGSSMVEAPAVIFPLILLAFFLAGRSKFGPGRSAERATMIRVVSLMALAALAGPVTTTTAGAFEPQCFVLVVLAAMAGLIQLGAWAISDRSRALVQAGHPDGGFDEVRHG